MQLLVFTVLDGLASPGVPVFSRHNEADQRPTTWASLIVSGAKDVENRTWPTRYRGPVLVHASQRPDAISSDEIERRFGVRLLSTLPLGGIVGLTEIVDCVKLHPSKWCAPGHWAFVLANSRPLPFVQWKGQLGIRDAPQELLELLDLDTAAARSGAIRSPSDGRRIRHEAAAATASGHILGIKRGPLAVNDFAVLCYRHVDAGTALGIDQFDGLRHCVGIFAAVTKRRPVPSRCGSCGRCSSVISANLWVSFIQGFPPNARTEIKPKQAHSFPRRREWNSGVCQALRRKQGESRWLKSRPAEVANRIGLA